MNIKIIKLFLRLSISAGFLSAVADRFGLWGSQAAWGNWASFVDYTHTLLPWLPETMAGYFAVLATAAELFFGLMLLIGYKTSHFAKLSGILLLLFALSMTMSLGIKKPLDFSVFAASGAAFALATIKERILELG